MATMSPQQQINIDQNRSSSLTDETKMYAHLDNKRRMKALSCRRQSAPSTVISKALTRSRTMSRENCLSPVSPETCLLVQSYLTPSRRFISHAYAQLKTGLQVQDRHLFLFTDILLISKAKSSTNFKMKAQARVCEMWTADCMEEVCEGSTSLDKSFVIGWPTCNCVATFSSFEQKERWLSLIKSRIKEEKEKDHPKTIPLKVYAKDMGNFSYKTLAVSNSDNANEVTRLALQQFGIVGCVKDYQLWVSSRKDNAPYPLIVDPDQKPFKRRRSLINWAFWRGSTTQLDDPPLSPFPPATGRLFGLPLSVVCKENKLPKPIMDMLVFLFQEGPFTRGIFRRSAGAKACRELRDRLDSGIQDIQFTRQSVFVIAADFLRSIPCSLLMSDFYEKWMATMDVSDEANYNQLKIIKKYLKLTSASRSGGQLYHYRVRLLTNLWISLFRLAASLPPENILLLKHVLAVLYSIQLRAQDNQMNAFNLAVCIAPSMLSSPAPSSPEMEGEGAKKVCDLARLMIENCIEVMGEDVTTLFDGYPQRCSTDGHGSDVSSYQMTDSSYDSLENELNDDSGSPFQPTQRSWGNRDSCSRDSVLTLSDCDLDQPDTEPDNNPATPLAPPPVRSGKRAPVVSPCSLHPLFTAEVLKGVRQQRRCSEPAIWNSTSSISKYLEASTNRKGSYDSVKSPGSSDIDKMFVKHLNKLKLQKLGSPSERDHSERNAPQQQKEQFKPPPLHLETSYSSLYSLRASPTHSSVSSLDSAFSQHSADMAKTSPRLVPSFKASVDISPQSPGIASLASPGPTIPSPRESPPKEKFDWSHLRNTHGLHPNTWLKKDHRLSLSKDKTGLEDDDSGNPHHQCDNSCNAGHIRERSPEFNLTTPRKRHTSPPTYQEALHQMQRSMSVYTGSEKPLTVKELRELHNQACSGHKTTPVSRKIQKSSTTGKDNSSLPQSMFYGQGAQCLALLRQKSHSLIPVEERSHIHPSTLRRASEPGQSCLLLDKEFSKSLECLRHQAIEKQDKDSSSHTLRLKVSDVESHDEVSAPQFCLSPAASKAVRDYFSWHGGDDTQNNLKKSQEVAMAVVHGKREWMRRCSDPRMEDMEKMFFAEESYV
ncbi:hypothetical protein P4O66_021448 [Electrophorus voltai]|uniref:Rho-GAP domain-containing protein n=1 Tax=Electrophorus voltai TaxID=2609070 RepID=A0AAD8ZSX0_9TELE|nr:hypothetical protein P4O66_021448 [Electrophorus voltai]